MRGTWRRLAALCLAAVMTVSLLPAALAAGSGSSRGGEVIIDVTDYGADRTGRKESSTAVIEALAYAATLPEGDQKTILFPEGEYHFYADYSEKRELYVSNTLKWHERSYAEKSIGILVEDMKNVTVDGGGSLFIFHGNICTMAAIRSENVIFTNFSQDHASPDVVDVTVESHEGEKTAVLYIPPAYTYTVSGNNVEWKGELGPVTGQPYWSGRNNLGYQQCLDTITGRNTDTGNLPFNNVASIQKVPGDPTHLKVTYTSAGSRPAVGRSYQMRNPNPRMTPGTFFLDSKDVTVSHANFHFLHGFGMVGQLSENITLDTVKYMPRPGTGRTSAGFADFVQMSSIAGEVNVINCEFASPHDDPINVHGTFLKVTNISEDRRTVTVRYMHSETWGFPQYNVGDKVDFTVQSTLIPIENSEREVVSVINPGEGEGRDKDTEEHMRTIIVTLDEPIPDACAVNNCVMENVTHTPKVLIQGCRFAEVPTRGILVTTRKPVVIKDNYFDRIRSSSIFISCDAQEWMESGYCTDVLIEGNTFIAENLAGDSDHYGWNGVIMVRPTNSSNDSTRQIHSNIVIQKNDFFLLPMAACKRAITVKSVNGLTVKDNTFRRYDPNVSLTLTAGSQSVEVGASQATSLTATANQLTSQLYRLEACKNVVMEGNVYDDGLNLGIQLDGNLTTAADIDDRDGVLAIGNKQLPAVGAVSYFSSDPAVAAVDQNGVVTGVSEGEAEIYAFRAAGGRIFESEHLTFTVTPSTATAVNSISISGGSAVAVDGTLTLAATTDPADAGSVAWTVKPLTDGASATVAQGEVTGVAPGAVEVTATAGGRTASKVVTVSKPNFDYLSDLEWESASAGDSSWNGGKPKKDGAWEGKNMSLRKADGKEQVFAKGIGTHADSTITYNLAGKGYTGFFSNFGISYYKSEHDDAPNLKFLVQGDSTDLFSGDATVNEAYKNTGIVDISGVETLTLKVTTNKTNAYSAHANWADAKLYTDNQAPVASDAAVTDGTSSVQVGYTYADNETDAEEGTFIAWYVSETENGPFVLLEGENGGTLPVTAAVGEKYVKAVVVPKDATGRWGAPAETAAHRAPAAPVVEDDATLAALEVSGLPLSPAFAPGVTSYTVNIPASVESVTVAATPAQKGAAVAGDGTVALTEDLTSVSVVVTARDNSTTKTYTLSLRRAKSPDASLKDLAASAGSASITYDADTRFYDLVAADGARELVFSAVPNDRNATVKVRYNNEERGDYTGQTTLPLISGLNQLELRVIAADGVSNAIYRVRVHRPASTDSTLASLSVNGGGDLLAAMRDGKAPVRLDGAIAAISAAPTDANATVYLSVDGEPVNNGQRVTLTETVTTATVLVVAEDGVNETAYTLSLIQPDPASADLYELSLGKLALSPAFDPAVTDYTAVNYGNTTATLEAIAAQAGAKITYETLDAYAATEQDSVSAACNFYKGDALTEEDGKTYNTVKVTVTSSDGKHTATYTVKVENKEWVYLSDLDWEAGSYSGWSNICKDGEVEYTTSKLKLWDGAAEVAFDKGLGTHANSEIYYDLSGMGFTRLTVKVGLDHSQSGNTDQTLRFDILGDGNTLDAAEGLKSTTAYEELDADLTGVSKLTLKVTHGTGHNGNAHADWADAKLTSAIPDIANSDIYIQHVEFEHKEHVLYANPDDDDHTVTLTPVIKPDGVSLSSHEKVLIWDQEDNAIATVVAGENNKGEVTAVKPGVTAISATATRGAKDSCTITVKWKLQGTPSVSGDLKYGSELTANVNTFDQDAKTNLAYAWYRVKGSDRTKVGDQKTYTPAEEDIGATLTVEVSGKEDSLYEGTTSCTTGEIEKADASNLVGDGTIHGEKCQSANNDDGKIVGFGTDYAKYEYRAADAGENDPWTTPDAAEATGLESGNYHVRLKETETHKASNTINVLVATYDSDYHAITIDSSIQNGRINRTPPQAAAGTEITLTITPSTGYELDTLTVDGEAVADVTGDTYTFQMADHDVVVSATFKKLTLTIEHDVRYMKCNMAEHDHTVTYGDQFSITLTPDEGYQMTPTAIRVTETDSGKAFRDYTYLPHPDDSASRVLTFEHGVTKNIKISGEAVLKTYTVDYTLTNGLTAPKAAQTVQHSKDLTVTLVAARGYALPEEIAVEVEGAASVDFAYDETTGVLTVSGVTGNVEITAAGVAQDLALQSVALVGPDRVGRTLTVNTVPVAAKVDYQWYYVENGEMIPIENATAAQYVIPAADEGKVICVEVTGKDGYKGTLTSEPTAAILPETAPFVFVDSVTLDETATVAAGKTVKLTAAVSPDNATSPALFWSSDNEAIATVDETGKVTGVAEGTVTITAAATDRLDAASATCTVTVTAAQQTRPSTGSSSSTSTKTEVKEDGTKVTTVTKPDGSKTITVTDPEGEELAKVELPATIPAPETKFEDLETVPWAEKAINNVAGLELVKGSGDNKYEPTAPMTRGALATVLHRLSQGKSDYEVAFKDVAQNKYYTEGVAWAAKAKVVTGYTSEIFAPNDIITREQLAVMLARYAKLIGMDTNADAKALDQFADGGDTGRWAVNGVAWCVEQGLMKGRGQNTLDPTAEISRAEVAVLLDRFLQLIK